MRPTCTATSRRHRAGKPGQGQTTVYNNHIARSKVNYQFTRELSLRAIVDYNGVLPNASLVNLDRTKRFGYDLLMTYLIHPGTALYIGYTDIYQNYLFDPSRPPYLQYYQLAESEHRPPDFRQDELSLAFLTSLDHCCRNATAGSTLEARRAGI